MKSAESSSAATTAESTMNSSSPKITHTSESEEQQPQDEINDKIHGGGGGDPVVWAAFTENFRQVQSVLDQNRALIQQVNENHQSKVHDNMVKNVALIQEINGNISKVVALYSDLSANFSNAFHGHQKNNNDDSKTD